MINKKCVMECVKESEALLNSMGKSQYMGKSLSYEVQKHDYTLPPFEIEGTMGAGIK